MSEDVPTQKMYHFRYGEDLLSNSNFAEQKEAISQFIKRQCNSENLHILIGSGCSLRAIPLMGDTFQKIKKNISEVRGALGKFDGDNKNIEDYMNWLNTATSFLNDGSSEHTKYNVAFDATKKELINSINVNYHDSNNTDTLATLTNYLNFYSGIFSEREFNKLSPINVFTTNYDLFNEIALEKLAIQYTNGFRGSVNRVFDPSVFRLRLVDDENRYKDKWSTIRRYVKLYKIHGSIDWKYNTDLKVITQTSVNVDEQKDIMIYPTIHKHLESQQTPYSELFREFTINLQKKNSTLIVMGYGFPDEHINQIISQSMNNEDFTLIIFGNKDEEKASAFMHLHRGKQNLHFLGGNFNSSDANGHHFHNIIEMLGNGAQNA
jgi:hypothetical protein